MPRRLLPPRGYRLYFGILLAVSLLFGALIVRSYAVTSTDTRLCDVIRGLVLASGRPPMNAPAYYKDHPEELPRAKQIYDNAISQLGDCKHLPTSQ